MKKGFIIAIDGPVAAGKGTIAPVLAEKLNGFYLYTGATYRMVALYCIEHGIDFTDQNAIIATLSDVKLDLYDNKVFLNNVDVTEDIKRVDVARMTPTVAAIPAVRTTLVHRQQEIAREHIEKGHIIAIEGRDTGTVVFPDAELKIFLTARPEIRAKRRLTQLQQLGNTQVTFESVLADLKRRDQEDTERELDPLVKQPEAYGYIIIDDSAQSETQTIENIITEIQRRNLI